MPHHDFRRFLDALDRLNPAVRLAGMRPAEIVRAS